METFKFIRNVFIVLFALGVTFLLLEYVKGRNESTTIITGPVGEGNGENFSVATLKGITIFVDQPVENTVIKSPLTVSGKAPGNWFFEASAPIRLEDENGSIISESYVTAQGNWMTTDYVPFTGTLSFVNNSNLSHGYLVLMKDNPSGESQFDDFVKIKVLFN